MVIDPRGLASWDSYWDALFMFLDWALGTGPTNRAYGSDSDLTRNMMDAQGVNKAREYFYMKNAGAGGDGPCSKPYRPVTNYNPGFGLKGLWQAGLDPTEQFVGNYRVDITPNSNGTITFTLTNTTSMTSFFYGIAPSWDRSTFGPGGNMTQTYIWTEPIRQ